MAGEVFISMVYIGCLMWAHGYIYCGLQRQKEINNLMGEYQ